MYGLQIFNNSEFGEIRTIADDDGVWFIAKDISERLGYAKVANMNKNIDEDDRKVVSSSVIEQGLQNGATGYKQRYQITVINESGLYAAIFGSNFRMPKNSRNG